MIWSLHLIGQGTQELGSLHTQYLWDNSIQVTNVGEGGNRAGLIKLCTSIKF
jgi:hypothetical protein